MRYYILKPTNLKIELSAINILERCLLKSSYLSPNLSKNDKTPSWDGEIFIHHIPDNQSKENLKRVQVQIKGHFKSSNFPDKIKYKIDIKDLKNYLNDSGVIFFVIYLSSFEHYCIYYNALTPYDLNMIVRSSSGKKSKHIEFTRFPDDDETDMHDILLHFHNNNKIQASTVDKRYLSLSEAKEANLIAENLSFSFCGFGLSQRTSYDFLFKQPIYLYAKQPGLDVFVPIDKANITATLERVERAVYLNDRLLYSHYFIIHEQSSFILKIGNLEIESATNNINFTSCGNLSNRLLDLEFFISLIKKDNITIEKEPFTLEIVGLSEKKIEETLSLFNFLLDVKNLIQLLEINEELQLDQFTDDDKLNLQVLVAAFIHNENVILDTDSNENFLINEMKIGNLNIFVIVSKNENGHYHLKNFFDKNTIFYSIFDSDGTRIFTNPYISLKKEEILRASNISFKNIYNSIISTDINDVFLLKLNEFILQMIMAYDENQNNEIYLTCLQLLDWLISIDPNSNHIYTFNKLQLYKRKRPLTAGEYDYLLDLKANETNQINLIAICILMDNFREAEHFFNKLPTTDQELIKSQPIFYFWKMK